MNEKAELSRGYLQKSELRVVRAATIHELN